jgi:hypothetical protein
MAKDLYVKTKTVMKENTNKWNDILHSWTRRINVTKMSALPKGIYRFSAILVKTIESFLLEIQKTILKFL